MHSSSSNDNNMIKTVNVPSNSNGHAQHSNIGSIVTTNNTETENNAKKSDTTTSRYSGLVDVYQRETCQLE